MFNERFAIQQRMSEIKDERRALQDEYYRLLDRLRTLDNEVNANDTAVDLTKLSEELAAAIQSVTKLVPSVSVAQVIENIKQESAVAVENVAVKDEPKPTEVQERIQKEVRKARVAIEASETTLKMIKPKEAEPIVLRLIKEEGVPLATIAIKELLEKNGYTTKTAINEIIRRLSVDGKIESPSYGFWQAARNEVAAGLQ